MKFGKILILLLLISCAPSVDDRVCETIHEVKGEERFVSLFFPDRETVQDEELCIPITSRDFEKIISMQYTIKWNPEVLKYVRLTGFGLPGLTADNFGRHRAVEGMLTYSWVDATLAGVTLAAETYLHEICFKAIGEPGSTSLIRIESDPLIVEIYRSPQSEVGLKLCEGLISIR